ncbi:MAG TPA: hypothetical protein PKD52_00205 [Clostridiales bacterium]|nr:hypothetical protein [Clostridiales bacterium]
MGKLCYALLLTVVLGCFLLFGCEGAEEDKDSFVEENNKEVLDGLDPESFDDDGTVVAFEGTTLKVTVPNFDADSIAPEDRQYWYHTVDEDTRFFTEDTRITFDEAGNKTTTIDYAEIGLDGFTTYLETGSAVCHFWLDARGCCTHIIIYGSLTIW